MVLASSPLLSAQLICPDSYFPTSHSEVASANPGLRSVLDSKTQQRWPALPPSSQVEGSRGQEGGATCVESPPPPPNPPS